MRISRSTIALGLWLLVAAALVCFTTNGHAQQVLPRRPFPSGSISKQATILTWWHWLIALAVVPIFWKLVRIGRPRLRLVALVLALAAASVFATISEQLLARTWLDMPPIPIRALIDPVPLVFSSVPFVIMALAVYLLKLREDGMILRAQVAESRLGVLTAQLQPHFLFNTLQAISSALHRDPAKADVMVGGLADLLRSALEGTKSPVVTLGRELELLESYLGIMRERFGDRVTIDLAVPAELRGAEVPVLLLQPLVENAFRHGVEAREGPARIAIGAAQDGASLVLRVSDDGPGAITQPGQNGTGLANTRERLAVLYGGAGDLQIMTTAPTGVTVVVRLPFRRRAAAG